MGVSGAAGGDEYYPRSAKLRARLTLHPKMGLSDIGISKATSFLLGAAVAKSLRSRAHRVLIQELKSARHRAGLSQQRVADILDVQQSYVAKIELGERRIDVIEFLRFVEAVNASPADILDKVASAKK
jgi:DNA-binding transcriptional regulator YiaG